MESKYNQKVNKTQQENPEIKTTKIQIKTEYSKKLPFEYLPSRLVTALVLSYADDSLGIIFLLQRLSHKTRAYIHNEKGLKGFLIEVEHKYMAALCKPSLQNAMRWQHYPNLLDEMFLQRKKADKEWLKLLKAKSPGAAIFVMQQINALSERDRFSITWEKDRMRRKKTCYSFSKYVHGYILPNLQEIKERGSLKYVQTKIELDNEQFNFTGEEASLSSWFGKVITVSEGIAVSEEATYQGTWKNGKLHGICKQAIKT